MTISRPFFLWVLSIFFTLLGGFSGFAQSSVMPAAEQDFSDTALKQLEACLSLETGRDACYAEVCEYEPGYLCAEDILDAMVVVSGPEQAMEVLHEIMVSPLFAIASDGHLLSHVIGRATSRVLGSSGEYFLRCPHDFNDGCYHGFFEDTLTKVEDPVQVAVSICEGMPSETTTRKQKSYCYHGAGHVFLMNESYDLDSALAHCTAMPSVWRESCWGGVFMENAWASRDWDAKRKNFREEDPLYPCNAVDDHLKPSCYVEHYSYLMQAYTDSLDELVALCMDAGEYVRNCIGGIANMLQNPPRTAILAAHFGVADLAYMDQVIFLCNQFPDEYQYTCPEFLLGSIINFDYPNMDRVVVFCEGINQRYRSQCFRNAGSYLQSFGSEDVRVRVCMTLPETYHHDCIHFHRGSVRHGEDMSMTVDWTESFVVAEQHTPPSGVRILLATLVEHVARLLANLVSLRADATALESEDLLPHILRCISVSDDRAACYASLCAYEPGYLCAEDLLQTITKQRDLGPEVGMQALSDMVNSGLFNLAVGDAAHNLAHVVGRTTARHIGIDGVVFLRCPNSFDYGCVHGFLEIALLEVESASEKINEVCESLPEKPLIGRPNCYHGSGHGVMMHVSYNLSEALAICDGLSDPESCWSGVFMENIDGRWRVSEFYPENDTFHPDNPHAPCDAVEEKYRPVCYRLHMLYLVSFFDYAVQQIVDTCLDAGVYTDDCVYGFGSHALFEGLQDALHPDPTMSVVEKTIYLCDQFPVQHRLTCYKPAISQITVSHGVPVSSTFCEKVEEQYRHACYREVGSRLSDLVMNPDEKIVRCSVVPAAYQQHCLHGREYDADRSSDADIAELQEEGFSAVLSLSDGDRSLFLQVVDVFGKAVRYLVSIFTQSASAHDDSNEQYQEGGLLAVDEYALPAIRPGLDRCLSLPDGRGACYASLCGDLGVGYICAEHLVYEATALRDAKAGIAVIRDIADIPDFGATNEQVFGQHQLAHIVGRSAARNHGGTGEIFIQCPNSFDYGCHHGFFESALQEVHSPSDALRTICAPTEGTIQNDTDNCYHGGGHGVMMDAAYDLDTALAVCDALALDGRSVGGCYGGVFMESGKGFIGGRVPDEHDRYYREDDPLAPCNRLAHEYRSACYSSHFMYYVQYVADVSVENIVSMCRNDGDWFGACLRGASRLFIEGPQNTVLRASGTVVRGDAIEKTIFLCEQLPEGHILPCHLFLVDYYMDDLNSRSGRLEKAVRYCTLVRDLYRPDCFRTVSTRLNSFVSNAQQKISFCESIPAAYRETCLPETEPEVLRKESFFTTVWQMLLSFVHSLAGFV